MIDFKEVFFKNGKHVIFCKIEDLLKNFYHEEEMTSIQGHLEPGGKNWIIHCPFCAEEGHRKHKLYIDSDCSRGYCFVCGRIYINIEDTVKVDPKVPDFLGFSDKFKQVLIPEGSQWGIDLYYTEFDDYSEEGINYLAKRNPFLRALWEPLGIKFFNNNIVLPFFNPDKELVYYQIRFTSAGKDDIRYFFPPIKSKPPYILHCSEANPKNIIVVEGIFDAIAAYIQSGGKYVIVAVMGSKISDYQLSYIRNWYMPKKILIWMDEYNISRGIRDRMKGFFDYSKIVIVPSNGPDPEEVMMGKLRRQENYEWIKEDYGNEKRKLMIPDFKL